MTKVLTTKDFIKETLIAEIGDIVKSHPYLSFYLICSGIEFLGKCLDTSCTWDTTGKSARHFKSAIKSLFPADYHSEATKLYKYLRCGLLHSQNAGYFRLTELKNFTGTTPIEQNKDVFDKNIIILDYFYGDFVSACQKIVSQTFAPNDKVNVPFLYIGKI